MNSKLEKEISRNNTLKMYLDVNAAVFTPLPHYTESYTVFTGGMQQITEIAGQLYFIKNDAASNKSLLRAEIEVSLADYISKLKVFANFSQNSGMIAELKIADKTYRIAADSDFSIVCYKIHDLAEANLTELATYEISEDSLAELKAKIDAYVAIAPEPRDIVAEQKKLNKALLIAFTEARAALKKIDMVVKMIRLSNPDVYTGYLTAHKILDTGAGKIALRCKVIDAASGMALEGVEVKIEQNPGQVLPIGVEAFVPVVKKTTVNGGFVIKDLPQGEYVATFVYPGYVTMQQTINKYDGIICEVEMALERSVNTLQ